MLVKYWSAVYTISFKGLPRCTSTWKYWFLTRIIKINWNSHIKQTWVFAGIKIMLYLFRGETIQFVLGLIILMDLKAIFYIQKTIKVILSVKINWTRKSTLVVNTGKLPVYLPPVCIVIRYPRDRILYFWRAINKFNTKIS